MSIAKQICSDAFIHTFEFLIGGMDSTSRTSDERAIVAMLRVCKSWNHDKDLIAYAKYARDRLRQKIALIQVHKGIDDRVGYPIKMARVFKACGFPLTCLPVLEIGNDEIDFIEPRAMTFPVMRCRDAEGKIAIAMLIKNRSSAGRQTQQLQSVLAIYKRSIDPLNNSWGYGWRFGYIGPIIGETMNTSHGESDEHVGASIDIFPRCPPADAVHPKIYRDLLLGQNPRFELHMISRLSGLGPEESKEN